MTSPKICTKPPLGASIEEKIEHSLCILNSIIYHLQELSTSYDRTGNSHASYEVRKTHQKMVTMRRILHEVKKEDKKVFPLRTLPKKEGTEDGTI